MFSTAIIAPCTDVRRRLMEEGVNPDRIEVILNGFDLDTFHKVSEDRVHRLIKKYGIRAGRPIIGETARFVPSNGVQHIVDAFRRLPSADPQAHMMLGNARDEFSKIRAGIT